MTETTALAPTESVGHLPAQLQAAIEARKVANLVAAKLAEQNWGKALDLQTRRAVAEWGQRHRVDVTTEIDVLGGRIYLNATFYLRQLAALVERGVVEYAVADYISADPRLKAAGTEEASTEDARRLMERIRWGVPDAAAAACVFRVKLRALDREICGTNWCGGGTRKGDPVGDAEPTKTAATRAARRCLRQLVTHIRDEAHRITAAEVDAVQVGIVIEEETAKTEAGIAEHRRALGAGLKQGDPYADAGPADA